MADVHKAIGLQMVEELSEDASRADAPRQLKDDWEVMCNWLGGVEHKLNGEQRHQVAKAYLGYMAIGDAPSVKLIEAFKQCSESCSAATDVIVPPPEIRAVFDRLLATDDEIAQARSTTMTSLKPSSTLDMAVQSTHQSGGKRMQPSREKLLFLNAAWAAFVVICVWLFEPFGWRGPNDNEVYQVAFICLLPAAIWLAYSIYKRLD